MTATLLLLWLALLPPAVWAQDAALDPPGSVARLNLAEGPVSFAPADSNGATTGTDWSTAVLNRPLTSGDRLWTGPQARTELHSGSTALRMNEQTSLDFLALNDNLTQLRLAQGTLQLRVRTLFEGQRLEVDTPNLAFVISQPGDYRLDVNPASNSTRVVAQSGAGVIYGDSSVAPLDLGSQQQGNFTGTQLVPAAPGAAVQDSFDAWAADRDRREDQSVTARYVPRETVGYQQLDNYGDWNQDPTYGAVWLPRATPVNWAPYSVGHWAWVAPWGWTWVDDAPWGFAPFHYGRWAQIGPRWAWVPGRLAPRPVYAPALVAFVGGGNGGVNWNLAIGLGGAVRPSVGWFPLAPGEAFRPAYRVSPRYVTQVNNNIVVNNTVNVTNNYRYQRQPGAVTAVSRDDFTQGRPVRGNQHLLSAADLGRAQVMPDRSAMPQRPDRMDLRGQPSRPVAANALPPAAIATRPVVSSRDDRRGNPRDEQRTEGRDARQDNPRNTRPDGPGGNEPRAVRPFAPAPAATGAAASANPPPLATRPGPNSTPSAAQATRPVPDRSAQDADQRTRRDQQTQRDQQHDQLQRQQREQAQQAQRAEQQQEAQRDQQRRNQQQSEQAQRTQQQQQAQREQQQVQREQQRQQREQAQQQQAQQQQQQQQHARQEQQRQAHEQQQAQQQQQRQRQQQGEQAQRREQQAQERQANPGNERGPRGEGGPNRNGEP